MREKRTVSFNPETDELPEGRTDFQRLDNQTDEEIARAVADDPEAAPLLEGDLPPDARLIIPVGKETITIRLDREVVAAFRAQGTKGYQTRINKALHTYLQLQRLALRGSLPPSVHEYFVSPDATKRTTP